MTAPFLDSQSPIPDAPRPTHDYRDEKHPDYGPQAPKTATFDELWQRSYVADRLKSVTSDTTKLLTLTRDLNAKIEKSGAGSLSSEDLRTLAEMEKLAHNIKWKMKLVVEQSPLK